MLVLGIDCGLSGALAFLHAEHGGLLVLDMPTLMLKRGKNNRRKIDRYLLADLIRHHDPDYAIIEDIWGRPHNAAGGYASASLLMSAGVVQGVTAALRLSVTEVSPQRWKRALSVPAGKDAARARASELLPGFAQHWRLKKHDGRAEASLLALYGIRQNKSAPDESRTLVGGIFVSPPKENGDHHGFTPPK